MIKRTLFPSIPGIALALQAFAAAAESVPVFDVGPLCRAEGKAAPDLAGSCLADEKSAHQELVRQWTSFAPASRAKCRSEASSAAGIRSYVELLTCLQIAQDVKSLPKE